MLNFKLAVVKRNLKKTERSSNKSDAVVFY